MSEFNLKHGLGAQHKINLDCTLNESSNATEFATKRNNFMIDTKINPLVDEQSENLDEKQEGKDLENF